MFMFIGVTSAIVGAFVLTQYIRSRRSAEFDGGIVSQSWLSEHRAAKRGDGLS